MVPTTYTDVRGRKIVTNQVRCAFFVFTNAKFCYICQYEMLLFCMLTSVAIGDSPIDVQVLSMLSKKN